MSAYVCLTPAALVIGVLQGEPRIVGSLVPENLRHASIVVLALLLSLLALGPLQSKGATLCPAALSSMASMTARVICGYAAEVLLFGSALGLLQVLGAVLMALSSCLLVLAKKKQQELASPDADDSSQSPSGADVELGDQGECQQQFTISELRLDDLDKVLDLEARIFSSQNPLIQHCGLSAEEVRQLGEANASGWLASGCSLVIRDSQANGAIVAFALCEIWEPGFASAAASPLEEKIIAAKPSAKALFEVSGYLMAAAARSPALNVSSWLSRRTLRFCVGCTLSGYEGLGLQSRLREKVISLATERGFCNIVVSTANPATEHLWKKFGFEVLATLPLSSLSLFPPGFHLELTFQQKVLRHAPISDSTLVQVLARAHLSWLMRSCK